MNFLQALYETIGEEGLKQVGVLSDAEDRLRERLLSGMVSADKELLAGADRVFADTFTESEVMRFVNDFQRKMDGVTPTKELVARYARARGHSGQAIVEAVCQKLGVGVKRLDEANPFHDPRDGTFSNPERIVSTKGGSKSFQISKGNPLDRVSGSPKIGVDKKTGKKRAFIKWVSTMRPCGRVARRKGKDVRCWDGMDMQANRKAANYAERRKRKLESLGLEMVGMNLTDELAALSRD
jgi:hypothetical protein